MTNIHIGKANGKDIPADAIEGMFRLRCKVFHERLGWEVSHTEGREVDVYDDLDPIYMIAQEEDASDVIGCWRMLPTTGRYMLQDTFPQLLLGEKPPRDPRIWELSRFAVAPAGPGDHRQAHMNNVTMEMIRNVIEYADEHGIDAYVTVTSTALERLLLGAGIPLHRFGTGRATRIGRVNSIACWVPINNQMRQAVGARAPAQRSRVA